jgi:hypothetical protein
MCSDPTHELSAYTSVIPPESSSSVIIIPPKRPHHLSPPRALPRLPPHSLKLSRLGRDVGVCRIRVRVVRLRCRALVDPCRGPRRGGRVWPALSLCGVDTTTTILLVSHLARAWWRWRGRSLLRWSCRRRVSTAVGFAGAGRNITICCWGRLEGMLLFWRRVVIGPEGLRVPDGPPWSP